MSPRVALMFRVAGSSYFREYTEQHASTPASCCVALNEKSHSYMVLNGFCGGAIQVWPSEHFFLGGGVGLAAYGTDPFSDVPASARFSYKGLGLMARAGWAFAKLQEKHAFSLVAEGFPSFFGTTTVMGSALNLQYQML